jgi:ribonuclease HI
VFDNLFNIPFSPATVINHSYQGWFYANKSTTTLRSRNQVLLSWIPPPPGTLKLNIDGSRISSSGHIAAGGLLRNCHGDWIGGFSANLGTGEILIAELWSLYYGLKLALQLNCSKIQVESDSSLVVNLVKGQWEDTHPLHGLISDCKRLWLDNWGCSINHIYRECNNAADGLARMGHAMDLGWHVLMDPPPNLLDRLADDCNGRAWPRIVIA